MSPICHFKFLAGATGTGSFTPFSLRIPHFPAMNLIPLAAVGLIASFLPASAAVITQWNFNSTVPDAAVGTGVTTPSTGAGTSLALGTTASFASGDANGGSSDLTTGDDSGWGITGFPGTGAGDLAEGVQFAVDTTGYTTIILNFDLRHSNTSSRYEAVRYTLDGSTWITAAFFTGAAGDTWFNNRTVDFSSISGAGNNPNFGIQIVSAFETTAIGSGAADFVASNTGSTYAGTGTWRFDMVTVSGTSVPEPTVGLLGAIGILGLLRRRR